MVLILVPNFCMVLILDLKLHFVLAALREKQAALCMPAKHGSLEWQCLMQCCLPGHLVAARGTCTALLLLFSALRMCICKLT
jgi:hypothetical protein